ncbi:MAG TPA: hypothetical protein VK866_11520 [Acidimicrobiales bacterium]|nr:hypothetical protein [Acidimicrobiales bacterium]
MAVCDWCDQEMTRNVSCTVTAFHRSGIAHPLPPNRSQRPCGDCGTPPRGFHHPGCDMAQCPLCRGQAISCGCRFDEDGPDHHDEDDDLDAW